MLVLLTVSEDEVNGSPTIPDLARVKAIAQEIDFLGSAPTQPIAYRHFCGGVQIITIDHQNLDRH
ncbi:hypothetical protein IQ235_14940 [Oscillatoriales cyanobacterium LEGE 11467]|uniref:Uncharacterized protein n=1 Tax=Zarconia navalis LEGE 11467 TaxID=1828826 RepID=A0A928W2M6_9CYAN|nr:hypothetical protein [Zarconia navalis]MBE9042075.1 hypothetical protein [Zarconia navalis LEGE 11467]